jgi:hypothetical protein
MARYLGALTTRLARIEAERIATHVTLTTTAGRRVSLDVRDILLATGEALVWLHQGGERPASRALDVLARVAPGTQSSVLMGTAVQAAHAVTGGERT